MQTTAVERAMEAMSVTVEGATMKGIAQEAYGMAPEQVLRLAEVARPVIDDSEVLVRVAAASVDRGTWHLMAGIPYLMRVAGFGVRSPKATNPGRSFAGTVESVGKDVTEFEAGDEVYGTSDSAFAQYTAARPDKLALKPASLTFEQAASLPVSAVTALQAVRDRGQVQAGQQVLVIGASGGVGTFAVQIAKAFGAEVTGVSSPAKLELVRAIGADHVVDYTREDIAGGERRYDVILDIAGNRPLSQLRRALTPRGRLVIVGGETGGRWVGGNDRQVRAQLLSPLVSQTLGTFVARESGKDLVVLNELVDAGRIKPVIERTFPLVEVPSAIRHLVDGRARGKVVITVDGAARTP